MNPSSPLPLYEQLKAHLLRRIALGEWRVHEPIPAERRLVDEYAVSRITVQRAIHDLVQEGVLYRAHGKGTFVAPPVFGQKLADLTGFVEELLLAGLQPTVRVLHDGEEPAPPAVARALGVAPEQRLRHIRRLVAEGGLPLFVDHIWLPPWIAARIAVAELPRQPLYRLLEQGGLVIGRGEQRISAMALDAADAATLEVAPGASALRVRRTTYAATEEPLDYLEAIYRADRYEYVMELRRQASR